MDLILTNAAEICFKAVIKSIGRNDPWTEPNIVFKRSYNTFCRGSYVVDVNNICWSVVCNEEQPEAAFDTFMKLLFPVTNKHAPMTD